MKLVYCAYPLVAALLIGCATSQIPVEEAKPVPADRIYFNPKPSAGTASVTFVRDTGFVGSAVYQHISIDGERAASLDVGEKVSFRLAAGEHLFGVLKTDPFGTSAEYVIDQRLEPDRVYFYRVLIDGDSMATRLQRMSESLAR